MGRSRRKSVSKEYWVRPVRGSRRCSRPAGRLERKGNTRLPPVHGSRAAKQSTKGTTAADHTLRNAHACVPIKPDWCNRCMKRAENGAVYRNHKYCFFSHLPHSQALSSLTLHSLCCIAEMLLLADMSSWRACEDSGLEPTALNFLGVQ